MMEITSYDERAIDYGVCHHVVPRHFYIVDKLLHQSLCVQLRLRCVKLERNKSRIKLLKAAGEYSRDGRNQDGCFNI